MAAQPFVLPLGPSHEIRVDASEQWSQRGLVEASVVVDPPLHDLVEHVCKVVQRFVTATVESPASQLSTHLLHGLVAHRWEEADKELASLGLRTARTKRVSQEIESFVGVAPRAILILAVHDARLVWMEFQTTLR